MGGNRARHGCGVCGRGLRRPSAVERYASPCLPRAVKARARISGRRFRGQDRSIFSFGREAV